MSNKRTYSELEEAVICFNSLPLFLIADFLDPVHLLAMMYINKETRRIAAKKLNNCDAETALQQRKFAEWLKNPCQSEKALGESAYADLTNGRGSDTSGKFCLIEIESAQALLEKSIVVLDYKSTYYDEQSTVVVLDDRGAVAAIYKSDSDKLFQGFDHVAEEDHHNGYYDSNACTNYGLDDISIWSSGQLGVPHGNGRQSSVWAVKGCGFDSNVWNGYVNDNCRMIASNFAAFCRFQGHLSPLNIMTVIMHALSADPRVIFSYVWYVYKSFDVDIDDIIDIIRDDYPDLYRGFPWEEDRQQSLDRLLTFPGNETIHQED